MACGVPVLTSDNSSLAEIAEGSALLTDPYDVDAMAEAMERGLADVEERDRLRRAGLARASTFSWERSTSETLSVYEEALERTTVRAPRPGPERPRAFLDGREARAVVDTIAYGALFDYPMTLREIHRSLMSVALSRREIAGLLSRHPVVRSRVESEPPYHFLKGKRASIDSRREAMRRTRELLERERSSLAIVRRAPFVRMVALSGATAHENTRDEDVDLFVVTAPGRTWAVAFLLFVVMKLLGRRKTICLNYLVGEDRLALPEQDAFTAGQILALKPIAGTSVFYRLVRENSWGARFFPGFWERFRSVTPAAPGEPPAGSLLGETLLSFGGGFILERLGRLILGGHLRRRFQALGCPTSVRLEPGVLKLHFHDHGADIGSKIESILGEEPALEVMPEVRHAGRL
jgi:hypothetical protein